MLLVAAAAGGNTAPSGWSGPPPPPHPFLLQDQEPGGQGERGQLTALPTPSACGLEMVRVEVAAAGHRLGQGPEAEGGGGAQWAYGGRWVQPQGGTPHRLSLGHTSILAGMSIRSGSPAPHPLLAV